MRERLAPQPLPARPRLAPSWPRQASTQRPTAARPRRTPYRSPTRAPPYRRPPIPSSTRAFCSRWGRWAGLSAALWAAMHGLARACGSLRAVEATSASPSSASSSSAVRGAALAASRDRGREAARDGALCRASASFVASSACAARRRAPRSGVGPLGSSTAQPPQLQSCCLLEGSCAAGPGGSSPRSLSC